MSECKAIKVGQELITIFASEDDREVLEKFADNYQEEAKLQRVQDEELKEAIQGLTRIVEIQGKKANGDEDEEDIQKLQALGAEKDATVKHIGKLESDLKDLTNIVSETEKVATEMDNKKAEVERESDEIQAKAKYNFSLYTNISRIRWDYHCEEDQVKGFVANLNDVKPFCVDAKQNSKYFIANYLWDLMES